MSNNYFNLQFLYHIYLAILSFFSFLYFILFFFFLFSSLLFLAPFACSRVSQTRGTRLYRYHFREITLNTLRQSHRKGIYDQNPFRIVVDKSENRTKANNGFCENLIKHFPPNFSFPSLWFHGPTDFRIRANRFQEISKIIYRNCTIHDMK